MLTSATFQCEQKKNFLKKKSIYKKFSREFRERRKQNVFKNGYNPHHRVKKARRVRTQAFYPCPPPTAAELESYESDSDEEFIDYSAVRISKKKKIP